jgi:hypothetical protein
MAARNKQEAVSIQHPDVREGAQQALLEKWGNAPISIVRYGPRLNTTGDCGDIIPGGMRLIIDGQQVMDTCETPWCTETVRLAFDGLTNGNRPVNVLERGYGLGVSSRRIVQYLIPHNRARFDIIELNKEVVENARRWREQQLSIVNQIGGGIQDTTPNIGIRIHEGDAAEVTRRLIEEEGMEYDIIISDTYPISPVEEGVNDISDIEVLKRGLKPDGRFGFFAYYPGSGGGLVSKQEDLISPHFGNIQIAYANVCPHPDYDYLHQVIAGKRVPVKRLPVVICKNPVLNDSSQSNVEGNLG